MKNDYTFYAFFTVLIITFFTYYPSTKNDFTTWDDQGYITQNPVLGTNSLTDYFTKDRFVMGNYHPITMISYAIEYSFVGLHPRQYHLDNFILHLLNTALVFLLIYLLAGWQIAAFVAVLFGIHPMHVESVAWISERKDVLYSFFYLASIIFYIYYLKNKKKLFYASTFLLFALSLLSKGQAITLPIALLLVDYFYQKKFNIKNIYNKIPFLILSLLFGIIAIIAQRTEISIHSHSNAINKTLVTNYNFFDTIIHFTNLGIQRICFASYGLLAYVYKLFLPINLSCFYPYPKKVDGILPFLFYLVPIILTGLFILIFIKWRKNKVVVFGSLFFVATVFPVLQLFPVGSSIISDRYSYIPSIGLFFIIAHVVIYFSGYKIENGKWVESTFFNQLFLNRKILFAIVLFSVSLFAYAGNQRCKVWKDSETLYTNVLENYPDVYYIQYKLGKVYFDKGEYFAHEYQVDSSMSYYKKAILHFSLSIKLNSKFINPWIGLSLSHQNIGMDDLALAEMDTAINLSPNNETFINFFNDNSISTKDEKKENKLN